MIKTLYSLLLCMLLVACNQSTKPATAISFYHWKSVFNLTPQEKECLKFNESKTLYLKYFDVVKEEGLVKPVSVIQFQQQPSLNIIPVVFIKNNVFVGTDKNQTDTLVNHVSKLVQQINVKHHISIQHIQFDCDWTETTQELYFYFLKQFAKANPQTTLSATIRLHQIKYKLKTGIPPVTSGVLMCYNMGKIAGDTLNSIYDRQLANKYLSHLKTYSLPLKIALPIFTWGIQSRHGKVLNLLNKMSAHHFLNDSNFTKQTNTTFKVKNYCFKGGYYFSKDDIVKIESVSSQQLVEITDDITQYFDNKLNEVIFYDLDTINLNQYDKGIFKKIASAIN